MANEESHITHAFDELSSLCSPHCLHRVFGLVDLGGGKWSVEWSVGSGERSTSGLGKRLLRLRSTHLRHGDAKQVSTGGQKEKVANCSEGQRERGGV